MSKPLVELVTEAGQAFPDSFVRSQFEKLETGEVGLAPARDYLARFVAATLQELYGAESSDEDNRTRVRTALRLGIAELNDVVRHLKKV